MRGWPLSERVVRALDADLGADAEPDVCTANGDLHGAASDRDGDQLTGLAVGHGIEHPDTASTHHHEDADPEPDPGAADKHTVHSLL